MQILKNICITLVIAFTSNAFSNVTKVINKSTVHVIHGDIVNGTSKIDKEVFKFDVIVNAANKELSRGGGVCGAIFEAAEGSSTKLQDFISNSKEFSKGISTGEAVITPSFELEKKGIKNIIHAVGPIYKDYTDKEAAQLLKKAYLNSLQVAAQNNLKSIAFPFISSAIYGYPKPEAACVAIQAFHEYLEKNPQTSLSDIYLVLWLEEDYKLFEGILNTFNNDLNIHNHDVMPEPKSSSYFSAKKPLFYGLTIALSIIGVYSLWSLTKTFELGNKSLFSAFDSIISKMK